ncbi:hypothetical protein Tco_0333222 [Tanacetum coccineum]
MQLSTKHGERFIRTSLSMSLIMIRLLRDGLAIIKSKSKVRYSRSRAIEPRESTNAPLSTSTPSNSFEFQQLAASLEDKMDIRMSPGGIRKDD